MRFATMAVLVLGACGGKDDGGSAAACDPFVGTVFSLDGGSGTARGTLTVPADLPDGLSFEVMLGQSGAWYGLVPEDIFAAPVTCGGDVDFEIGSLEAGTYELVGRVLGEGTDEVVAEGYLDGTFDSADDVVEGLDVVLTAL